MAWSLARGLRARGGAGPCDLALRRRRRSAARRCGSTTSWGRPRRSSPGARSGSRSRARASTGSSAGAALTEQRVAIGADADGRFQALIHTGTVAKTQHNAPARAVHPAGTLPLRGREREARRRRSVELDMLANTFMRAPGRGGRHASRWSARSTSSPSELGIDPDRAADPQRARQGSDLRHGRSPRGTSSRPFARAPSGSAGPTATRGPAHAARANGSSAWAAPPPPIRTTASRAAPRGSR